jgi:hypothetical protein
VLAFLVKNPGKLRVDETDNDPEKAQKLIAFKKKLEEKRIVKYWEDGSQLVNDIKDSIHDIVRRRPGVGWIRGDQALDPTVYKDLEEVRRQNKELQEQLDIVSKGDIGFPVDLSHGSDLFQIEYKVVEGSDNSNTIQKGGYDISWDNLFNILIEFVIQDYASEYDMLDRMKSIVQGVHGVEIPAGTSVTISRDCIIQARHQFVALGLIVSVDNNSGALRTDNKISYITWQLTEKGRRYFARSNALKRPVRS